MGSISKTALGLTCQYWNIQSPHAHNYGNKSDFVDGKKKFTININNCNNRKFFFFILISGLDDAQNFCRLV